MRSLAILALVLFGLHPGAAQAYDWAPARDANTAVIVTTDEDGEPRETTVWIVVLDDTGWVRTNDSAWLANIRRGSSIELRVGAQASGVRATEVADAGTKARVEDAFKAKYGTLQRMMSALRTREPTVLELSPAE